MAVTQHLTIIIPSFAMQAETRRAVESVLAQDMAVAIIVVDDASEPPITLPDAVIATGQVRLLRHDTNKGAAAARNTGVAASATEWVGFLDADDTLLPDTLAPRLAHAQADKGTAPTIYGCGWLEPARGRIRIPLGADTTDAFASGCWYAPGSCLLGRKNQFESLPFQTGYKRLEDFDWSIRFGMAGGRLVVLEQAGAILAPGYNANYEAVRTSADAIRAAFSALQETHPHLWANINAYLHLELAVCAYRQGKHVRMIGHLVQSWRHRPRWRLHFSPGWTLRPVD